MGQLLWISNTSSKQGVCDVINDKEMSVHTGSLMLSNDEIFPSYIDFELK